MSSVCHSTHKLPNLSHACCACGCQLSTSHTAAFSHLHPAAQLRSIPGVGPYTAAAVGSIAFGDAAAAVDGNVVRVLSRLRALSGDPTRGALARAWDRLAAALLHPERPGCHNQVHTAASSVHGIAKPAAQGNCVLRKETVCCARKLCAAQGNCMRKRPTRCC
jgi:adenine-specific DNA glycosylase